MALILFYFFKELKIRSAFVNKMAGNVFAVFALNNSLVLIVMEALRQKCFWGINERGGFLALVGILLLILLACLLTGGLRETVLGRVDRKLGAWVERETAALKGKIRENVTGS